MSVDTKRLVVPEQPHNPPPPLPAPSASKGRSTYSSLRRGQDTLKSKERPKPYQRQTEPFRKPYKPNPPKSLSSSNRQQQPKSYSWRLSTHLSQQHKQQ